MNGGENSAVFLSYASQDAEAAKRIGAALREAGVEVWIDQSELVGGDAWDAKIRKQIADCALFIPLISAHTQARREGYFRLEWRLAAQRTHMMSDSLAFVLPVVIDDTRDANADVPAEFKSVQWTRLPVGEAAGNFAARVRALVIPGAPAQATVATPPFPIAESPLAPRRGRSVWLALAAIVVVAIGALFVWRREATPSAPALVAAKIPARGAKSIVVLPFENLSDDKQSGYFADGMQDDVITNLHLIRELNCVPRATAMSYRDSKKGLRAIADELGVAYVLTGTVRRADNRVHITGTLVDARTDEAIWTRPYEKNVTDLFAIQAEMAQSIAAELKATLTAEERTLISRRPTEDSVAYDLFLQARTERNNTTNGGKDTLDRQIAWLQAAVARDAQFGIAWAYLARAHALYYRNNHDHSPARLEMARQAMEHATQLAPDAPEILLNAGDYYLFCFHDQERATEVFEKARRIQPGSSLPLFNLANVQREQGRWLEAWNNYQKTTARDPGFIDGWSQLYSLAQGGRRFPDARVAARRVAELRHAVAPPEERDMPNYFDAELASVSEWETGATAELEAVLRRSEANPRAERLTHYVSAQLAAETGNDAEVVRLDRMKPTTWAYEVLQVAVALMNLGQRDAAFARIGDLPAQLKARLALEPDNETVWGQLSRFEAVLGHKDEAIRCARERIERTPLAQDHWRGTLGELDLAFVYTWTGETTKAIDTYAKLLSIPIAQGWEFYVLTPQTLKHGVWYRPLRGHPAFDALCADPKNQAPLF